MDQGPEVLIGSGLERYLRQDEAPMRDLGRQDEFPTALVDSPVKSQTGPILPAYTSMREPKSRVCGLRVSTFRLVATVIVLLVVAGVGMGVLGSRIISKRNDSTEQKR